MTIGSGARISEHLSVGVLARSYPREEILEILRDLGLESRRVRGLPNEALVHYIIALGLFMAVSTDEVLRCLVEGLRWIDGSASPVKPVGKVAISQARSRLGAEPLKRLWHQTARVYGLPEASSGFYREWRLVAIDGSTLDVPDTRANLEHFGKQDSSRGEAAFPQMRFVGVCECATRSLFAVSCGPYRMSESELAEEALGSLEPGMLCLADRLYMTFPLWTKALESGADLLWRVRNNAKLEVEEILEDGSFLSRIYPNWKSHRRREGGTTVRIVEYRIEGAEQTEELYRVATSIIDPAIAPAEELAALYHQRWEVETLLDEFKTHMRGGNVVLRSKTPVLIEQEFYGMLLAHRAVRALMFEAASDRKVPPERLSFTHSLRVIRRKLTAPADFSPSAAHK